jgi:hypothetical protein
MQAPKDGIIISKDELLALLGFTNMQSPKLSSISLEATIRTVTAMATDGHSGIRLVCDNDGHWPDGARWSLERDFLDRVNRAMATKDLLRLAFSGSSLTEAVVLEVIEDGADPVIEEREKITWPRDACIHQLEFPFDGVSKLIRPFSNDKGVPQSFAPRLLKRMALLAKLNAEVCNITHGRTREDGATWSLQTSDGTDVLARVMPYVKEEQHERPSEKADSDKQPCLWDQTKVSMTTMDGETVELGTAKEVQERIKAAAKEVQERMEAAATSGGKKPKRRKGVRSPEDVEQEATAE